MQDALLRKYQEEIAALKQQLEGKGHKKPKGKKKKKKNKKHKVVRYDDDGQPIEEEEEDGDEEEDDDGDEGAEYNEEEERKIREAAFQKLGQFTRLCACCLLCVLFAVRAVCTCLCAVLVVCSFA